VKSPHRAICEGFFLAII